ncbi:META domain-containing protein [Arthrobacter caoxuetaonis]|uniref:META domain-containing protein n=1 Tax=Arthrobacter caoxuetaonis TaxID=2886935 RepID=UPI001D13BBEB|nr:META domain-containing protein [Arthrobacter caoxuetaonis]MCC3281952.1 META domain-containing protein [Arthrobacter caoxuetaonis]MCC3283009.1 META domain-containing protein [Arthrobacter caoxuetaonis]
MRTRFTFLALALLLGAAACAADPGGSGSPASPDDSGSGGPSPSSSAAGSAAGTWGNPENTREPSLELHEDGRLTGTDGCNRLMGQWVLEEGKVIFKEVAMTMMACPDVDQWLASAVSAVPAADTLLVYDGAGNEIGTLTR